MMLRRFLFVSLLGLLLLPGAARGQERADAKLASIAPFLDNQTIAVGRLDLRRVDVQAAMDFFAKDVPEELLPPEQRKEVVAKATELKDQLLQAGASEVFVIVSLEDFPRGQPLVVLPLAKGADPNKVQEVLTALGSNVKGESLHGAIVLAPQGVTKQPAARPDLAKALATAGDTAIQFAVSPAGDVRRVLRETLPPLPAELGGTTGAELADSFSSLAVGINLPPRTSLSLTVQAQDAKSAALLGTLAKKSLDLLSNNEDVQRQFPPIEGLAPLLAPQVQGDKLVLKIDEQQGNLAKVVDELVRPAVEAARSSAQRAASTNNLRQLLLAMHTYHDTFSKFPAQASRGKDGKKLLSWRVHVLPFVEQGDLYEQFHLDEPWDSEHNKRLIAKMPPVFAAQSLSAEQVKKGMTNYLVPVGPKTVFEGPEGISLTKITDGTSNTIAIVQAAPEHAVEWTRPDDWNVDFSKPLAGLRGKPKEGEKGPAGFNAALCDGSVRFISYAVDWDLLRKLLQKDDGEVVGEH